MKKHWQEDPALNRVPNWVPNFAVRYLAHTEKGISIRELARRSQVHASTVMRQIRRVETKRDDPLIDEALARLGEIVSDPACKKPKLEADEMKRHTIEPSLNDRSLKKAAGTVLQELSEPGAVLAFAKDMEKAVVVRDLLDGSTQRTAVVDRPVAQAMALKDWISCKSPGRISRYQITASGRVELAKILADASNSATGFAEAQTGFEVEPTNNVAASGARRVRFSTHENPVAVLARRKDKEGQPFLATDLVAASERLREDFELSQLGTAVTQNWDRFLTAGATNSAGAGSGYGHSQDANDRLQAALGMLGEGLSDVALRCCCHQEGMESVEKRLGWPARSGKVVLRIALIKLREYYNSLPSDSHDMIG